MSQELSNQQIWSNNHGISFHGYFKQSLFWNTVYNLAPMAGLPDTHGYSMLPDIRVTQLRENDHTKIGWIEDISMHSGGTVVIKHFALSLESTRSGIGKIFLDAMMEFFKEKKATAIEFHERHTSKIHQYDRFFEKNGIKKLGDGAWRVELYEKNDIPKLVLDFQSTLEYR